jgi:hypothetical protein
VDYAHTAFTRHRYRQRGFSDGIHRRRNKRDIELYRARKPRAKIRLSGEHGRPGRQQQNIVKSKAGRDIVLKHSSHLSVKFTYYAHSFSMPESQLIQMQAFPKFGEIYERRFNK